MADGFATCRKRANTGYGCASSLCHRLHQHLADFLDRFGPERDEGGLVAFAFDDEHAKAWEGIDRENVKVQLPFRRDGEAASVGGDHNRWTTVGEGCFCRGWRIGPARNEHLGPVDW